MPRLTAFFGFALAISAATTLHAQQNSFAQTDISEHLFAHMTEESDGRGTEERSYYGLPNTGIVYSVGGGAGGQIHMRFEGEGELTRELPLPLMAGPDDKISAWPMFIKLHALTPERGHIFLLGVGIERSEGYSGGGAREHWLHLFRVDNPASDHGRAREVLTLPLGGDKLIRACFSEADEAARQGVCHDSYAFEASLSLDESNRGEWPVLVYSSLAMVHPGVLVEAGSNPDRPLTTEELAQKEDRRCSLERELRFDPITRRYEMDRPAPDCSSYFLPGANAAIGLCRERSIGILAGQTRINDGAAREFTGASIIRQIRPGDPVTEDLRPERATIETDPSTGKIVGAWCG